MKAWPRSRRDPRCRPRRVQDRSAGIHPRALEHTQYCAEYLAQGDLEKAETRCHLALEFNPDMPEPYNLLGLIEMRRDHWEPATALLRQGAST